MIVTDDMPCNCRHCHVCAILGIAYPLARPPEPTAVRQPAPPAPKPKPTPTLFEAIDTAQLQP
jgi:hypothetical protein